MSPWAHQDQQEADRRIQMVELKSFIQLCIEGKAKPEQINDWIDKWHEPLVAIPLSLHTYLGMTWEEYGQWVQNPSTLSAIIEAHKEKHDSSGSIETPTTDNTHNS
jgi:hypothetical protein